MLMGEVVSVLAKPRAGGACKGSLLYDMYMYISYADARLMRISASATLRFKVLSFQSRWIALGSTRLSTTDVLAKPYINISVLTARTAESMQGPRFSLIPHSDESCPLKPHPPNQHHNHNQPMLPR